MTCLDGFQGFWREGEVSTDYASEKLAVQTRSTHNNILIHMVSAEICFLDYTLLIFTFIIIKIIFEKIWMWGDFLKTT